MNIDVYNTHIEVYPYSFGDYPIIESWYTAKDKFTNTDFPCGYLIQDNKLYLPRGTSISHLESMTGGVVKFIKQSDPHEKMTTKFYPLYEPRNEIQEESIKFLKDKHIQQSLNLQTGFGKSEPVSRKIPCPDGYIRMGDLQVGDYIFGSDGSKNKVEEIFDKGELDVYQITFSDGRIAKCSLDHLWRVRVCDIEYVLSLHDIMTLYRHNKVYIPVLREPVQFEEMGIRKNAYHKGVETCFNHESLDEEYIYNSREIRSQILFTILENSSFVSENKELLEQLQFIARSLGFEANIKNNLLDVITTPEDIYIKHIKFSHREECRCIRVSANNALYLTEDFIVTHNTYCVANAVSDMNDKTIIITPNESIKLQWIKTFRDMFEYRSKHIMNIAGSNIIEGIMNDDISMNDTNVFLVNHQTLHSYMFNNNGFMFHQFFKKLKVGIKVYDESHLNFMNILLIDFFTNTKKTIYLSATFSRSDKTEAECFKRAFNSAPAYGEQESMELVEKHVIYHIVNINSKIDTKNRARLLAFPGYTSNKFGVYAFTGDPHQTMYNTIKSIISLTENLDGKTLIFVPLIEAVDSVASNLRRDFPDKRITPFHSKMSKDEKENMEKYDIIVSTIKSAGTGKDIPGLRVVINSESFASTVLAQQVFGRLRPYTKDKETFFFDIVDTCIPQCNYYFRARFKKIESLAKKVVYLDINK